jgi:predicted DNA binding protein
MLATTRRLSHLLVELTEDVTGSPTREAVERTLCGRMVDSELYETAWVGGRAPEDDRVVVRTHAGFDGPVAAEPVEVEPETAPGRTPWARALRTGAVQVADAAEVALSPSPDADRDPGGSVAAIPLGCDGSVYGVLTTYAERAGGIGEFERTCLGGLGETAGVAVDAIRSRELLFADAAVELEFSFADRGSFLVRASADLDCRISLAGQFATGDRWLAYCEVDGTDGAAIAEVAARDPDVENCRILADDEDRCRLRLMTADGSLLGRVAAAGATVGSAVADRGVCRATVEAPTSADVREITARLQAQYSDLELVSRCDRDGPPATPTVPDGLPDDVTDRQRDVLETAFRAGYFEWPRESTAEELAADLRISPATLLGHLRKAEQRLLSDLFD